MKLIKKILFFTLVGSVKVTLAQMGVYAEYVTKSDALFLPMSDITMTVNIKPGACLQEVKKGSRASDYFYSDTLGIKIKSQSIGCAADNWENVRAVSNEKELKPYTFVDVKVVKTNDERIFLEQVCKKAIITYKLKAGGFSSKYTMEVWHTTAKDLPSVTLNYGSIEEVSINELTDALKELGGVIMYNETTMSMLTTEVKTTMECVKFEVKPITDQMIKLDLSKCGRTMNFKEYSKKAKQNERRQNSSIHINSFGQ